jgi:hypothetical protein
VAGTAIGARRRQAATAGVTLAEFERRVDGGEKWCWRCHAWHPVEVFGIDASRSDGRDPACLESKCAAARANHKPPVGPRRPGPARIPRRSGDKLQARSRINHDVSMGQRPNPNDLPCTDCGHLSDDLRHEYDHYLGYDAEHHGHVEPVCSRCHRRREDDRRGRDQNFVD